MSHRQHRFSIGLPLMRRSPSLWVSDSCFDLRRLPTPSWKRGKGDRRELFWGCGEIRHLTFLWHLWWMTGDPQMFHVRTAIADWKSPSSQGRITSKLHRLKVKVVFVTWVFRRQKHVFSDNVKGILPCKQGRNKEFVWAVSRREHADKSLGSSPSACCGTDPVLGMLFQLAAPFKAVCSIINHQSEGLNIVRF